MSIPATTKMLLVLLRERTKVIQNLLKLKEIDQAEAEADDLVSWLEDRLAEDNS